MEGKERSEEKHSRRREEKPKGRKESLKEGNVVRHLLINMIMQYLQIVTINEREIVLNRVVFQFISLPSFLPFSILSISWKA